jgi:hypothetical protein
VTESNLLRRTKTSYARTAQQIGGALARAGVLGSTPPHTDRRIHHWLYSLTRIYQPLALSELGVPWWTYRAVDVVDAWMAGQAKPLRVFEYGSGGSTLWLARRSDEVMSVEHDVGFAELMKDEISARPNVELAVIPPVPADAPAVPSHKEGYRGLDFTDYVNAIHKTSGDFSLIVIDGRAREACLVAAAPRLASDGIIIFDNSRRRRYREAIAASGFSERRLPGLTPSLPYPDQTSLLGRPGTPGFA